jgi:hypothetical protein
MAAITDALDTLATAASDYLTAAESVADALSELDSADLDDIKDAHVRSVIAHLVAQAAALEPDRTGPQNLVDLCDHGYDVDQACGES